MRQTLGLIPGKENLIIIIIIIIRNSEQNIWVLIIYIFGSKIWSQASLLPPNVEVPTGVFIKLMTLVFCFYELCLIL